MISLASAQDVRHTPKPGFQVSCLASHGAPFVHLTLTLRQGMGLEVEGEHGYFSLLGTMLGRGCGNLDRSEFARDCDSRGANVNIYPGRDFLTLEMWVLPSELPWALKTLRNMVWDPRLESTEVGIAVEEQLDQLLARRDEKRSRLFDAARAALFPAQHHYSRPLLGTEECLRKADAASLRRFHRRLLEKLSVVLCVTGGVTDQEVFKLLQSVDFGDTLPHAPSEESRAQFIHSDFASEIITFPVEQAEVLLAIPAVPRCHPDYRMTAFCNEILGGAFLSRLTRSVRIHGGMAYSADSRFRAGLEAGVIWVALQTDQQKVSRALGLVRRVMDELVEQPLNEEEFLHFKEFVQGSMQFDYDALSSLTSRRLERFLYGEEWQLRERLQRFQEMISSESTLRTFRQLLRPQTTLVCALGEGLSKTQGEAFHRSSASRSSSTPALSLVSGHDPGVEEGPEPEILHQHPCGSLLRLSNGLHLLVLPREDVASLSVQVWSMTGAVDEVKGKTGLSHLLEHLMFRGTEAFPDGTFDSVLAQRGGLNNAFTTEDFTVYTSYVTPEGLSDALMLEADRWQNLEVGDKIFRIERDVVLEERSVRVDCNPLGKAYEHLQHLALGEEPYGHPVIGWRDDLERMERQDVQVHYDMARDPGRLLVVIAGGCSVASASQAVRQWFGNLPAGRAEKLWPVLSDGSPVQPLVRKHAELSERSGYSYLLMCYRFPREGHPDYEACELLTRIVGDGDSCRLHEQFVKERRWFLEVWTNYESQSRGDPLFFIGFAAVQNFEGKPYGEGVARYLEELSEQLTVEELEKAKCSWVAEEAFGTDELEDWSLEIAGRVFLMPWEQVWEHEQRVERVTLDDLKRVAQEYLRAGSVVTVSLQGLSEDYCSV